MLFAVGVRPVCVYYCSSLGCLCSYAGKVVACFDELLICQLARRALLHDCSICCKLIMLMGFWYILTLSAWYSEHGLCNGTVSVCLSRRSTAATSPAGLLLSSLRAGDIERQPLGTAPCTI